MLRTFVSAVLALVLVTGVSFAGGKGKANKVKAVRGTIKKVDAQTGTLTVAVTAKKAAAATDMEFKISNETKVVVVSGKENKEFTGVEGLKNEGFKEGAVVTLMTAKKSSTVTEVRLGETKKKKKAKAG